MDHSVFMYPVQPNSDTFDKLVIMGGRDLQQYCEDAYTLELSDDLASVKWSEAAKSPALEGLVCNNVCDAVESVPYHKVLQLWRQEGRHGLHE